MNRLLIALSGARAEILDQCPTERIKFQSLGWAILITSGMATVSMWFALSSALGTNPILAFPAALMWGLIIMGIDRWLITSIPATGSRRWTIAIPRLVLAILLGTVISTPLVLRIFQSEINAQITVIKEQRASAFLAQQQRSQVGKQVTHWGKVVADLQKVIDSGGLATLNPSADPVVRSLTKQRAAETVQEQKYYEQWQCQLYGGTGCTKKGNGPLAKASENSYHQAKAQVAKLTAAIQAREQHLTATDQASRRLRLSQARSALPAAKSQLALATARENTLTASFDARNESTNGLLIRLQALSDLTGQNSTLDAARILLFLLFLLIECLPVMVKLLQRPGNYEKILKLAADRELKDAARHFRNRPASGGGEFRAANGDFAASDAALRDIWRPTKVYDEPLTESADSPSAAPDPADEMTQLDNEALRGMEDTRAGADTDDRRGISIRKYADDAL